MQLKSLSIKASEAVRHLALSESVACVDVRSEGEAATAAMPGAINLPILQNEERHQVGKCFKENGQTRAIELGYKLTEAFRAERVAAWDRILKSSSTPMLFCWRGGLRSQIACEWLHEIHSPVAQVEGGYKKMRQYLLEVMGGPHKLHIVSGYTGSGKSELLLKSGRPHLDLERFACHRGSAFGADLFLPQPKQASFENLLGLDLLRSRLQGNTNLLVEDESSMIGQLFVPQVFFAQMQISPVIKLRVPLTKRVDAIFSEYVQAPLAQGVSADSLLAHYKNCLEKIHARLGGQLKSTLQHTLTQAFTSSDPDLHRHWIGRLLENYYDKAYKHAEERMQRPIAFEGDWEECLNWIQEKFD